MEVNRPGYYAVIPADVRYDARIPPNAKLLYGEISALISKDGFCYASNQYFAEVYGFSLPTVTRLITSLEDCGYLTRQLIKDKAGKVVQRKLFLSVSVPDIQPPIKNDGTPYQNCLEGPIKNDGTPYQNCLEGPIKNDGYTNLSNTNIEKENKKEKARRASLEDKQMQELFKNWIQAASQDESWSRQQKNDLFFALCAFYEPRPTKKQDPCRSATAFKSLTNRLLNYSEGRADTMLDILERATASGWKSVYPPNGTAQISGKPDTPRQEVPEW